MRGQLHRYNGVPRQDDFAVTVRRDGRQLIIAVADGISSARQSHLGATTAVRYATQWLDASVPELVQDTDWRALIESTAWALVEQAKALLGEHVDAIEAEDLLATTLVCAVVDRDGSDEAIVHIAAIGDSGAWVFANGSFKPIVGGKSVSTTGISSSAVVGLPRVPVEVVTSKLSLLPGEVLLLGTDGFGDPLGGGDGDVGNLFGQLLGGEVPSMIEFAHALDFSRETFDDDRTLVAVWPRPPIDEDVR